MAKGGETKLFVLGASHRSAAMELREKLYIEADKLELLLPQVRERFHFAELCVLSTCNRFEMIGLTSGDEAPTAHAMEAYLELQRASGNAAALVEAEVVKSVYLLTDADAVSHVYRVAASLDSLVVGETQITGQFKDAVSLAQRVQTLGPTLGRLAQEALAAAKKVRTQTAIGRKTVSISHAAIELAKKVFGELSEHRFLVIGAGEMAQVAAKYVKSYEPRALYVANRTLERGRALTAELGFGEAHALDELPRLLIQADVVVSSTAAAGFIVTKDAVLRAMKARRGRPLILLDIALPRDVDPACSEIDDVYVFDIDDLQQVVDQNVEERQKAADEAQALVDRSVEAFVAWQRTLSVKPALAAFRGYLDGVIARESQKTLARSIFQDLSEQQRAALQSLFEAIAGAVSGDASRRVVKPGEGHYPEQLAEALRALFPLGEGDAAAGADDDQSAPPGGEKRA